MDNQKLGIFITELRKEKGLTQAQLAQKLNVTDKAGTVYRVSGEQSDERQVFFPLGVFYSVRVFHRFGGGGVENHVR